MTLLRPLLLQRGRRRCLFIRGIGSRPRSSMAAKRGSSSSGGERTSSNLGEGKVGNLAVGISTLGELEHVRGLRVGLDEEEPEQKYLNLRAYRIQRFNSMSHTR